MSLISKNANITASLNGQPSKAIEGIQDVEIIADFGGNNVQANITATNWKFYNEDALAIKQWVSDGKMYEGMPFELTTFNDENSLVTAKLLLDLTTENFLDSYDDNRRVTCDIVKEDGLNIFFDKLKTNSLAFLESKGVFTANDYQDCKYIVQEKVNIIDELIASVILAMMVEQLIRQVKEIGDLAVDLAAIIAGGVTGSIAAIAFAIGRIIVQTLYAASILIVIIDLGNKLFNTLNPPLRTHKTLNYKLAMTKICAYFNLGFNTSISLMDDLYYLPSNPQIEQPKLADFLKDISGTPTGIPRANDFQYNCESFFEEIKTEFQGKFAIVNNTLEFHPEDSPFWLKNSTYTIPQTRPTATGTNASKLIGSRVFSFSYDLNDEYTIDDQTGRIYEVQTSATNQNNSNATLIKGSEKINFNICLGKRKDDITPLEETLLTVGEVIDKAANWFGGSLNLTSKITAKKGVLLQSSNWHSLPKVLVLQGDKIHPNYKQMLSAESIYNNYYSLTSFTLNNFAGQKSTHKNKKIGFGLNDFIMLTDNSYADNGNSKVESIKWKMLQDYAIIDYESKYIFAPNLKENYINP